jgi:hypothetical protein
MTQDLIDAAVALADTLSRENRALTAMDLARAVSLLAEKNRAMAAFTTAHAEAAAAGLNAAERLRVSEQVGRHLRALAIDNKRLLEQALMVQKRVIGTLAQAAPTALPRAPRYGSRGEFKGGALPAVALSTRA